MTIKGLTRKDLKLTQKIRKEIRKNDDQIRRLLSKNDGLRTQLVRVCFNLDVSKK